MIEVISKDGGRRLQGNAGVFVEAAGRRNATSVAPPKSQTRLIPDSWLLIPDMDRLKIALAFACIALGVAGYYYFSETAMVLRILMVLGGLAAAAGVAWLSAPGKEFFAFAQEAWAEAGRVAWPTRKETMQTT